MNKPYHNDQAHIAEEFQFTDDHITQTARLAYLKINSYKLSQINAAFCMSQEELASIIKNSLLNFRDPAGLLADLGYFCADLEN
jgi:hypothetical protein